MHLWKRLATLLSTHMSALLYSYSPHIRSVPLVIAPL